MAQKSYKRPLFGREPDLDYLAQRAGAKGLTAVVGRPQAGKSWLLQKFADRLASDDAFLVGYAESTGQYADLLLRSLRDLYTRWLSDSSYLAQAKILWQKHKKDLITKVGGTVGSMLGSLLEVSTQGPGVGNMVSKGFKTLHQANLDLQAGGIVLPALDYDQAHDLLLILDRLSGGEKRAVLILDAFDQSTGAEVEAGTLRRFLSRLDEWPECHIFVATRDPDAEDNESVALRCCRKLKGASPAAELWPLPGLHLKGDVDECDRLLYFLRDRVPAIKDVPDHRVVEMIGVLPGVINFWLKAQSTPGSVPKDEQDLRRLASDAFADSHRDLEPVFSKLMDNDGTSFRFAVRIALLPEMGSEEDFEALRPVLSEGLGDLRLAKLRSCGLLEHDRDLGGHPNIPTFGHTTRYEAARFIACTDKRFKPFAKDESGVLAIELACRVTSLQPDALPFGVSLLSLRQIADHIGLPDTHRGLCESAAALTASAKSAAQSELIQKAAGLAHKHPGVGTLVAMGLFNALFHAKRENDLPRRDALLDELRELGAAHPDSAGVQQSLAMALSNTLVDAREEENLPRWAGLLDELRELAASHSDHADVQDTLGRALFNTLDDAKEDSDLPRRDALLDELRELARRHPVHAGVQENLAMGLFNTLVHAKEENDVARRDGLLIELRGLAGRHPNHAGVQECLAKGLFNTVVYAKEEDDLSRPDALVAELRELAVGHPENAAVQEALERAERLGSG